jgi:catechol 2,3-dioxygenase-like lactoylglutathione lyase family enzyme
MRVIAIDHVQLAIPPGGEPAARAFYSEVLGFVEVPRPEAMRSRGGLWFQAGPVQIHLGVEPDMRPSSKAHPALVVTELDAWLARLAAAGHRWQGADEIPGVPEVPSSQGVFDPCSAHGADYADRKSIPCRRARRGHTWDPFGNRIELIEAS